MNETIENDDEMNVDEDVMNVDDSVKLQEEYLLSKIIEVTSQEDLIQEAIKFKEIAEVIYVDYVFYNGLISLMINNYVFKYGLSVKSIPTLREWISNAIQPSVVSLEN